jgi:hypothetical protein
MSISHDTIILWKTCYSCTYSVYVGYHPTLSKFVIVGAEGNISCIIFRYAYDLSPYQISHAGSSGSLIIVIKPKLKDNFHTAFMLLFYILQKIASTKDAYFSKTYYHPSFQDIKLSLPPHRLVLPPCCYYRLWEITTMTEWRPVANRLYKIWWKSVNRFRSVKGRHTKSMVIS